MHDPLIETRFIFNYDTGEIEPSLGERMTANGNLDVWKLKVRQGVRWRDGEVFDADDVLFTVNMFLDHAPGLFASANLTLGTKTGGRSLAGANPGSDQTT